ncbi:hypothetical protein [Chromobacterium haemolyticum]|uniref:hypothetical protein n=1 Tax=Chromobacterium haemolyticum TaxID=394935 RepID=UPI001130435D|nr:hypothetical protein [Chromobacterium haemolyticum]
MNAKQRRQSFRKNSNGPKANGVPWSVNVEIDEHMVMHIEAEKEVSKIKDLIRADVAITLTRKPETRTERFKAAWVAIKRALKK